MVCHRTSLSFWGIKVNQHKTFTHFLNTCIFYHIKALKSSPFSKKSKIIINPFVLLALFGKIAFKHTKKSIKSSKKYTKIPRNLLTTFFFYDILTKKIEAHQSKSSIRAKARAGVADIKGQGAEGRSRRTGGLATRLISVLLSHFCGALSEIFHLCQFCGSWCGVCFVRQCFARAFAVFYLYTIHGG